MRRNRRVLRMDFLRRGLSKYCAHKYRRGIHRSREVVRGLFKLFGNGDNLSLSEFALLFFNIKDVPRDAIKTWRVS